MLSSRQAAEVAALHTHILEFFRRDWQSVHFAVPYAKQTLVRTLHLTTLVLDETYDADGANLQVLGSPEALAHVREHLGGAGAADETVG
jgi:50S ribosomal subunit-associated GTPase HflX